MSNYVWKVERWLSHGFVLQQKYKANTDLRDTEVQEVNCPAFNKINTDSRDVEFEEIYRIIHISDLSSIDATEVQAKAVKHMGEDMMK